MLVDVALCLMIQKLSVKTNLSSLSFFGFVIMLRLICSCALHYEAGYLEFIWKLIYFYQTFAFPQNLDVHK